MTEDQKDRLTQKLIAAGGWIKRGANKNRQLKIAEARYAIEMAEEAIEQAREILMEKTNEF